MKGQQEMQELIKRKQELEYLAQMSALQGLSMDEPLQEEYLRIKKQLATTQKPTN